MSYKTIDAINAKKIMKEKHPIIVDVRESDEFDSGHINDAVLLPLGTIRKAAEEVLVDKTTPVLVYCRSGKRSAQACEILTQMGYLDVSNFGGILDWPYEIEK